jgi:chorismate mutase/prephenate dehydratase
VFAQRNVNVRQIENRPGSEGQASFFLEISGHHEEPCLREVIEALTGFGAGVKVLGSYPAPGWIEER